MPSLRKRLCLFILVLGIIFGLEIEESWTQETISEEPSLEHEHTPNLISESEPTFESSPEYTTGDKANENTAWTDIDIKEDTERIMDHIAAVEAQQNINVYNSSSPNSTKVNCLVDRDYKSIEIVNAARLTKLLVSEAVSTNRTTKNEKAYRTIPAACILVLFYAKWSVFSSQAAARFNALPRFFPSVKAVAIDVIEHQSFIAQYGIVGVPTLMLVHNGKPVAKFNGTAYTLKAFEKFILHYTNLQPNGVLYLTSLDYLGPLKITPNKETDSCLILSWVFIAMCALYFTSKSRWWQQFVELVQNTWRESNAQHEHAD